MKGQSHLVEFVLLFFIAIIFVGLSIKYFSKYVYKFSDSSTIEELERVVFRLADDINIVIEEGTSIKEEFDLKGGKIHVDLENNMIYISKDVRYPEIPVRSWVPLETTYSPPFTRQLIFKNPSDYGFYENALVCGDFSQYDAKNFTLTSVGDMKYDVYVLKDNNNVYSALHIPAKNLCIFPGDIFVLDGITYQLLYIDSDYGNLVVLSGKEVVSPGVLGLDKHAVPVMKITGFYPKYTMKIGVVVRGLRSRNYLYDVDIKCKSCSGKGKVEIEISYEEEMKEKNMSTKVLLINIYQK